MSAFLVNLDRRPDRSACFRRQVEVIDLDGDLDGEWIFAVNGDLKEMVARAARIPVSACGEVVGGRSVHPSASLGRRHMPCPARGRRGCCPSPTTTRSPTRSIMTDMVSPLSRPLKIHQGRPTPCVQPVFIDTEAPDWSQSDITTEQYDAAGLQHVNGCLVLSSAAKPGCFTLHARKAAHGGRLLTADPMVRDRVRAEVAADDPKETRT